MLDLKTILVVNVTIASLQAAVWIFVWRAWRHLYELRLLAAAFSAIAIGMAMMLLRGDSPDGWAIVLHNIIIKLGLVLLAEGLSRFLGQPRYGWIGFCLLVFQLVVWSTAVWLDPGDIAIRIHTSTLFTIVMMSLMCMALWRDRSQPKLLRWATMIILAEYMVASVIQSIVEFRLPSDHVSGPILADRHAWYLLQGTLFMIALFVCLIFMVASRLSADLRDRNESLVAEVNHRRALELRLSASLDVERSLREEQANFMRMVSHEFRTPLAVIRNSADMLAFETEHGPDAKQARLGAISECVNRMFALIDRFMSQGRQASFQPEPIEIGALISEVSLHFDMIGRGARLNYRVENAAHLIQGDPEMLVTVIVNLIDNALKYSPEMSPVTITAAVENGFVTLEVIDQGVGIPPKEVERVGTPFFRASNARAINGTGLGLYACRQLLAYHGGTLTLHSPESGGTTASIRIPLDRKVAVFKETATA